MRNGLTPGVVISKQYFRSSPLFRWNTARIKAPSPKLQASEKLQIPSSKLQTPKKFQAPNFNAPPWMATTPLGLWWGA